MIRLPTAPAMLIPSDSAKGTYLIILRTAGCEFTAGALGEVRLPRGMYAYAGSALGPGGLRARLARHARATKPLHWHIDYFTALAPIVATFSRAGDRRLECVWAQALLALPGASAPAPGFGASDCRRGCPAHLIRLPAEIDVTQLEDILCQTLT